MRFMTFALALAGLVVLPLATEAATYQIDTAHSSVEFTIRHLVGRASGRFTDFSGTIEFDEAKLDQGKVTVSIKAASIDTDNEERDQHLRSADFFDVETYPEITFTGEAVKKTEDGFEVNGMLSMHGVEKEVVLPVEFLGVGADPWGFERAGFYTELELNRQDYEINWNKALDKGGVLLGDEVTIRISIEAMRPLEQAEGS